MHCTCPSRTGSRRAFYLVFLLYLLLFLSVEASGAGARLALLAQDRAPLARSTRRVRQPRRAAAPTDGTTGS